MGGSVADSVADPGIRQLPCSTGTGKSGLADIQRGSKLRFGVQPWQLSDAHPFLSGGGGSGRQWVGGS